MHKYTLLIIVFILAVHSSGAIRPATTNDSRLKCGSVLCDIVSDIFSKAQLGYGYNHITTIPAGAMNVTVKQLSKSDNYLALKAPDDIFIINGNKPVSESGIFEYNEVSFDYNRELGMITAKGPLTKPVDLLLFVRGINTGIKYDYTHPVPSAPVSEEDDSQTQWNELGQPLDEVDDSYVDNNAAAAAVQTPRSKERKKRKFSWKLLGFGQCNRSCGPGVQPPIFRCIRDSPNRFYSPKRCASVEKPVFSEDIYHCNRGLCPAYWRAGDYGECRCNEGESEGVRKRYVKCVQEQITGKIEEVSESFCEQEKLPDLMETCHCPRTLRRKIYARDPERTPRTYARLKSAPITVRSINNSSKPLRRNLRDDRVDKKGVWLMSGWNEDCTDVCGVNYQHRSIYCDRTAPFTDLCDLSFTPEQRRLCSTAHEQECQRGEWFASTWSSCTGHCFELQRKRTVLCLKDGIVVDDKACAPLVKPESVGNCTFKDVDYCGPKWHYSEWSECSRTCGEGIQRRYAKCLEFDFKQNAMVESGDCKYLDREPVYGACNSQQCEEIHAPLNIIQQQHQNNAATSIEMLEDCTDEFSNCQRINRQRLCKLQYYKTYCCSTCNGYY